MSLPLKKCITVFSGTYIWTDVGACCLPGAIHLIELEYFRLSFTLVHIWKDICSQEYPGSEGFIIFIWKEHNIIFPPHCGFKWTTKQFEWTHYRNSALILASEAKVNNILWSSLLLRTVLSPLRYSWWWIIQLPAYLIGIASNLISDMSLPYRWGNWNLHLFIHASNTYLLSA